MSRISGEFANSLFGILLNLKHWSHFTILKHSHILEHINNLLSPVYRKTTNSVGS